MALRCYACKESIDDDACFCDQCGKEIFKCGSCGHLGKGPRCPQDGIAMLARKQRGGTPATPVLDPSYPPPVDPKVAAPASTSGTLHLRSTTHGVDLVITTGDLLGRLHGQHTLVLQRFSQISSRHLELRRAADGRWLVKDLNSFNHSFYNGKKLTPQAEVAILAGGVLSLGDVALTVSLE